MTLTLNARQLAFLWAAAHRWPRTEASITRQDLERATDSGQFPILSDSEILALANQLALARSAADRDTHLSDLNDGLDDSVTPQASGRSASHRKPIAVNLSDVHWDDRSAMDAKPRSRLITVVNFNKVPHHLDAIEVRFGRGYRDQLAAAEGCQPQFERHQRSDIDTAPFFTVTLDHRRYALFVTPFSY